MPGRRYYPVFLIGLCIVAYACLVRLSEGRSLGAVLTGKELLVAVEKDGPGEMVPGIYAVGEDGKPKLVVEYGKHPRWSPDHKKFAYQSGVETWVANLERRSRGVVAPAYLSHYADAPYDLFGYFIPYAIEWNRSGDAVDRWEDGAFGGLDVTFIRGLASIKTVPSRDGAAAEVAGGGSGISIGKVSQSVLLDFAATEHYRLVHDVGALDREVWTKPPGKVAARRLELPGIKAYAMLNPLCAPNDYRVSVDYIETNATYSKRHTVIYEGKTGKVRRISGCTRGWTQALEWSPNGEYLLVGCTDAQQRGMVSLSVVQARPGEEPRVVKNMLNTSAYFYQACWSPDGERVAFLQGDDTYWRPTALTRTNIHTGHGDGVALPDYLRVTSIDW